MANFEDLYEVLPPCGVVVSRLCPCLAFMFKPQHADREVETVSLMGSARSRAPDPDTDHVPSAAAEMWFQKMQASVYRGEPRRRALAAGRSRPAQPIPQPTPQPPKSPKPKPQKRAKSPKPQPQEEPQEQPQPQKSPGKVRSEAQLRRSSKESTASQ